MRFILFVSLLLTGCASNMEDKAQSIIDKSIAEYGGAKFEKMKMAFDLRDRSYTIYRRGESFVYTRSYTDTLGNQYLDSLSPEGFKRYTNGELTALNSRDTQKYSNGLNGVIYFATLPYRLNDGAVQKTYIGKTEVESTPYYITQISFIEEGGGKDHEDVFLYWFNAETYLLDYLAYSFIEDGGGLRFRKAFNRRDINGVFIQDYLNYKPLSEHVKLEDLEGLFQSDSLELVSEIRLENVFITIFDE